MDRPMVSVCMITYNHENYIAQAIKGVLAQKINFDIEFIIANDASTDKTDQVVTSLINESSHITFKYYNHANNLGMYENFLFSLNQCIGKYIALCEGDDFWIDPFKLQKQVDFLEDNQDFEVCFTNVNIVDKDGNILHEKLNTNGQKTIFVQRDLPIWASTLTRVFRNHDFTGVFPNVPGLDTAMLLYQTRFGKIKFLDEIMGTYRSHNQGAYNSKDAVKKKEHIILTLLGCLQMVPADLMPKYFGMIYKKLVELKPMDKNLYQIYQKKLRTNFKNLATNMKFMDKLKTQFGFLLLHFSSASANNKYNKFILKIFSRLYIY